MKFNISTSTGLQGLIRTLTAGLNKLTLQENFENFEVTDLVIPTIVGSVDYITIRNELTFIPSKYIIVKQTGNGLVTAADRFWTLKEIYMKNHGPDEVTVTIMFMR